MRGKNVIVINGHEYDALTGLPLSSDSVQAESQATTSATTKPVAPKKARVFSDIGPAPRKANPVKAAPRVEKTPALSAAPVAHASVHAKPDRSHTLNRTAIKRPVAAVTPTRSPQIQKFAPHTTTIHKSVGAKVKSGDVLQAQHIADDVLKTTPKKSEVKPLSAKEQLIKQGMDNVDVTKKRHTTHKHKMHFKLPRFASAMSMVVALLVLGGYMTYINMPGLSVRVASSRAGITANYPEYTPDGYRFNGPVAFGAGEVMISFKTKSGNLGYTVSQRASNWDSRAVLDNYVNKEADTYLTYSAQGLTVYAFNNKAAWVNGGILYTIDGDAPLSNEQILKIAASL